MNTTKLILLRGNSGSGKSTIARELRKHLKDAAMLVEQDHFRRVVLKEKDTKNALNAELIFQTVEFGLRHGYHVILEGILKREHYQAMFDKLWQIHPDENYIYYFDIPFEETLKRHVTKPNASEWGEEEMKRWWLENDVLELPTEQRVPAKSSIEVTTNRIIIETGLNELYPL